MKRIKFIITITLLAILLQQSKAQIIHCEYSWAKTYKITAKSGLKLRDGQGVKNNTIVLIPYHSEVKVCQVNSIRDTIEGLSGRWVKAFWANREGYLFDGYIEKVESISPINLFNKDMNLVNEWKNTIFTNKVELFGLYRMQRQQEFEIKKIELIKDEDSGHFKPLVEGEIPFWIISKTEDKKERIIKGKEINRMLFIGEKIATSNRGIIYGDGILNKTDSINAEEFEIDPYELRFQYRDGEKIHDELLLRMKCIGGISKWYGYEARAMINFIGDLDGDSKDDILITYSTTYKGWYYAIFSTRYAKDGRMFKEMIVGSGSE